MEVSNINDLIIAQLDTYKISHMTEIFTRNVSGKHQFFAHVRVTAGFGSLINQGIVFSLKSQVTSNDNGDLIELTNNPTTRQDSNIPTVLYTDRYNNKKQFTGYLHQFNDFPCQDLSGFLFFDFPLQNNKIVVSNIVDVSNN